MKTLVQLILNSTWPHVITYTKRDLKEETGHAYGNALRDALSAGGKDNITKDNCQGEFMESIHIPSTKIG